MIKTLDCTLRDGGYYTNWDFDKSVVDIYLESINNLPIDYIEIGYRNYQQKEYQGKYFYSPIFELQNIRQKTDKKIVIILNEKDIRPSDVSVLLGPCVGLVDMVRIALAPENLVRALALAEELKKLGFEVGFNVMYMSKWKENSAFTNNLTELKGLADYFYMVDSYGGVYPQDVIDTIQLVRSNTDSKLGFHGHNNLELALINTLTALENGVEIIDATILGMGRGAGNLKTELLLTVMNSKYGTEVDFNSLGKVVQAFEDLHKKHNWGTNLPYMISGSSSLPQKEVMEWTTTGFYSLNSIVRALDNQNKGIEDNEKFPLFSLPKKYDKVIIIGGGNSAINYSESVRQFVSANESIALIHASSKNASEYIDLDVEQVFCLVGNEGYRMEKVFSNLGSSFSGICVLPPFPRKMGTYVPNDIRNSCRELEKVTITSHLQDTHTVLALQSALELGAKEVYLIGYDGYYGGNISSHERTLTVENENLFKDFSANTGIELISFCPTMYTQPIVKSIYSLIYEQ